jgi:tRNA modification GTPase
VDIDGLDVTLVDTAGWREASDLVEREGVARGERARAVAELVLVVVDQSTPITAEDTQLLEQTASRNRLVVANKSDLPDRIGLLGTAVAARVSAKTGDGLAALRSLIAEGLAGSRSEGETVSISNLRHLGLLEDAGRFMEAALVAASRGDVPEEVLLVDLQAARSRLGEIVGLRAPEELLRHIFERFCIGK